MHKSCNFEKMELSKPKPRKSAVVENELILPLKGNEEITGVFNGQCVVVSDQKSMNYLHEAGNFGKGTLSRGNPTYHMKTDDIPRVFLKHQFENHSKWTADVTHCLSPKYTELNKKFNLSMKSLNNLWESSLSDSNKLNWTSWKEQNLQENKDMKRREPQKPCSSMLKLTDDCTYEDENFINLVDGIIQSRSLKKPQLQANKSNEVVVLDSCFDANLTDFPVANINSRLESSNALTEENLSLGLEESFFLKSELGCLKVVDLNFSELGTEELWEKFNAADESFRKRYVAYHFCKGRGWVVKSGLKFGGDFLLYKDGPAHYHSSYLLKVLDKKKLSWREFVMMNRLVETFNKDLIVCNIFPADGSGEVKSFPEAFTQNSIQQVQVKRWFPSKERLAKED